MTDQVVNLGLRCVFGKGLKELGEILDSVKVVPTLRRVMHIPGHVLKFFESRQEVGWLAQG
jgi:hypothetical protein